jgi:hypothetical protein
MPLVDQVEPMAVWLLQQEQPTLATVVLEVRIVPVAPALMVVQV